MRELFKQIYTQYCLYVYKKHIFIETRHNSIKFLIFSSVKLSLK